ncbi:MAG: hypothetical protein J1D88_07300 [Treponema sp.]|nr:hypothetical protein [Treponema sp.]
MSGYQNTLTDFASRDDVFTFLIHLGYLAYDERERQCYIPNREIHEEWMLAIQNDDDYKGVEGTPAGDDRRQRGGGRRGTGQEPHPRDIEPATTTRTHCRARFTWRTSTR